MSDEPVQSNQSGIAAVDASRQTPLWVLVRGADGDQSSQPIAVDKLPFRIGRVEDVSLQLPFSAVSSHHAELFEQHNRLMVRDLGSTNGTFVNGVRITDDPVELKAGSILQIAQCWMHVRKKVSQPALSATPVTPTIVNDSSDDALALTRLPDLLRDRTFTFAFEPVVDLQSGENVAWFGIASSRIFGLTTADEMLCAAKNLNREEEFCHVVRTEMLRAFQSIAEPLPLFVDIEPWETNDYETLRHSLTLLRDEFPTCPIHLNAHPDACFASDSLANTRRMIADLGMQLSLDDFGDGQSRLVELTELSPSCVWFENRFADNLVAKSSERLRLTQGLVDMVAALGCRPAIKGVASEADAAICKDLGFAFAQGPWFTTEKSAASC